MKPALRIKKTQHGQRITRILIIEDKDPSLCLESGWEVWIPRREIDASTELDLTSPTSEVIDTRTIKQLSQEAQGKLSEIHQLANSTRPQDNPILAHSLDIFRWIEATTESKEIEELVLRRFITLSPDRKMMRLVRARELGISQLSNSSLWETPEQTTQSQTIRFFDMPDDQKHPQGSIIPGI